MAGLISKLMYSDHVAGGTLLTGDDIAVAYTGMRSRLTRTISTSSHLGIRLRLMMSRWTDTATVWQKLSGSWLMRGTGRRQ